MVLSSFLLFFELTPSFDLDAIPEEGLVDDYNLVKSLALPHLSFFSSFSLKSEPYWLGSFSLPNLFIRNFLYSLRSSL